MAYVNATLLSVSLQTLHIKSPASHALEISNQCLMPTPLLMAETSRQGISGQRPATQPLGSYTEKTGALSQRSLLQNVWTPEQYIRLMMLILSLFI